MATLISVSHCLVYYGFVSMLLFSVIFTILSPLHSHMNFVISKTWHSFKIMVYFIHLEGRVTERGWGRDREILHLLVHSACQIKINLSFKKILFYYYLRGRYRERRKDRDRSSILWLTPLKGRYGQSRSELSWANAKPPRSQKLLRCAHTNKNQTCCFRFENVYIKLTRFVKTTDSNFFVLVFWI